MQSPSSSSSLSYSFTYQVFLSFRGSDTRYGFIGNLYKALIDKGIHTFIDDRELKRGDEIRPSLIKTIEGSRIFIPVFSANYASSSFCLDELVQIIHCHKTKGRLVLPIFFGVDPTDVRHHTGIYGEALAEHEKRFENLKDNMERMEKWKTALTQAANLSGDHHFPALGYEYKFIEEIVEYISNKINRVSLHVANYPVGLESRVQQVKSLLDRGSDDEVNMVGIYGTGGLGKSTLARAIYNFVADQFECLCFLHHVRENSAKNGLKYLQEELLLRTVGLNIKLGDVSEGIPIIKERLHKKKILLILDDVDKLEQLQALVGGLDWFGRGTRIIITTRDKHLLTSHEIERAYAVKGLYGIEALELLRWMAFKNNKVPSSYEDILNRAVNYASGLPLAIEIVGSNLFRKSIEEWKNTLEGYEKIPNKEIQKTLRVSYDALEEDQQSVFLDIACCFKGCAWMEVKDILHAHYGHCIEHHVGVLAEKSLIKISEQCHWGNDVTLHDLIEDMGKEIVRQQSPIEPGERSRLWCRDDIVHVLEENTGTGKIEMIYLNCPSMEAVIDWNGKAFKKMINLKTLIVKGGHFSKGTRHFPRGLRVLEWQSSPLECKHFSFFDNTFKEMKILKFDNCKYLTDIPNVSGLPNLENFSFKNCKNLITIHDSVGFLSMLQILNAEDCEKLLSFPPLKLNSLIELKLSGCSSLKSFPEILGKMKNISSITLTNTAIEELPFSFENLTELFVLSIHGSGKLKLPSSILMMSTLFNVTIKGYSQLLPKPNNKHSSMLSSHVSDISLQISKHEFLTTALTWFSNVEFLMLSGSNIKILPECLKKCHFLKRIKLDGCKYLEEIKGIPPNLTELSAIGCASLSSSSKNMLVSQELHEAGGTDFCFPSSRIESIPRWFKHKRREPSISFLFRYNLPSLVFFFSSKLKQGLGFNRKNRVLRVYLFINDHVYTLFHSNHGFYFNIRPDYTYLFSLDIPRCLEVQCKLYETQKEYRELRLMLDQALLKKEWIHAEVRFVFVDEDENWDDEDVVESGVHVVKHLTSMSDVQFTDSSSCKNRKLLDEYLRSSSRFIPPILFHLKFMNATNE